MNDSNEQKAAGPEQASSPAATCSDCGACNLVCPVAERMDLKPGDLVAARQAGDAERAAACSSIWECLDCRRCTNACGSGIDVYGCVQELRAHALKGAGPDNKYARYLRAFQEIVAQRGRFSLFRCWRKAGFPEGAKGLALYRLMKGAPKLFTRKVDITGEGGI